MNQGVFLVLRAIAGLITVCALILFLAFCGAVGLFLLVLAAMVIAGAFALDGIAYLYRQAKKLCGSKAK